MEDFFGDTSDFSTWLLAMHSHGAEPGKGTFLQQMWGYTRLAILGGMMEPSRRNGPVAQPAALATPAPGHA